MAKIKHVFVTSRNEALPRWAEAFPAAVLAFPGKSPRLPARDVLVWFEIRAGLDVFAGDIRDPHGVRTAMQGCDAVLHLAALIAIPYSYHSPDTYIDTNVKGTLNVLQAGLDT